MKSNKNAGNNDPAASGAAPDFGKAKLRLASHPNTEPQILGKLAEKGPAEIQERVAENPNVAPSTLEQLAEHESAEVRSAVTENLNTPNETLEKLVADENPDVRYRLAENPETPVELLETLADDQNPYVTARALETLARVKSISERADDLLLKEHYAEAEDLYRCLIGELEELLGAQHHEVGIALHKYAAVVAKQMRPDEAAELEERSQLILCHDKDC